MSIVGYEAAIPLASPPAQTNAGSDTPLTWAQPVRHMLVQNNTAASVMVEQDAAASLGATVVAAGQLLVLDVPCAILHLYTAAAQNINGTAGGGIVVRGWA
jgi:hypothetical protein